MKKNVRTIVLLLALLAQVTAFAPAHAQTYPTKPIRVILPYAPGGGAETQTRMVTGKVSELLGQPMLIENRPGGAFAIATGFVAKSAPDGYTLYSTYSSMLTAALTVKDFPIDVIKSFAVVSWLTESGTILAVPASSEAHSLKDLMDMARKSSRQLSYGSTGLGGTQHLNAEMVMLAAHAKGVHVPYKGSADAATALLGQQIDFSFVDNSARPLIKAGKLRALVVSSSRRSAGLPDVPTVQESIGLPGAATRNYYLVPAATPAAIVGQINAAVLKVLRMPDMIEKMTANGYDIIATSPEEGTKAYVGEYQAYSKLLSEIDLKID